VVVISTMQRLKQKLIIKQDQNRRIEVGQLEMINLIVQIIQNLIIVIARRRNQKRIKLAVLVIKL